MRTGRPEDGLLVSPFAQPPWLADSSRAATVLPLYIWCWRPVLEKVFEFFFVSRFAAEIRRFWGRLKEVFSAQVG